MVGEKHQPWHTKLNTNLNICLIGLNDIFPIICSFDVFTFDPFRVGDSETRFSINI